MAKCVVTAGGSTVVTGQENGEIAVWNPKELEFQEMLHGCEELLDECLQQLLQAQRASDSMWLFQREA